ncbi:MAG: 50S ribosomal protein L23 [Clostridia bacterium]|nr:50S ribosomal protein L23 [Clostridia bacterium]
MVAEDIIIKPIITEKSNEGIEEGKYTFKVAKKATKPEIADAVEKLFNVKVLKVNTMNIDGKQKRVGVHQGKTANWKKAIVFIDTDPQTITYTKKGGKETKGAKKYNSSIEEFLGA